MTLRTKFNALPTSAVVDEAGKRATVDFLEFLVENLNFMFENEVIELNSTGLKTWVEDTTKTTALVHTNPKSQKGGKQGSGGQGSGGQGSGGGKKKPRLEWDFTQVKAFNRILFSPQFALQSQEKLEKMLAALEEVVRKRPRSPANKLRDKLIASWGVGVHPPTPVGLWTRVVMAGSDPRSVDVADPPSVKTFVEFYLFPLVRLVAVAHRTQGEPRVQGGRLMTEAKFKSTEIHKGEAALVTLETAIKLSVDAGFKGKLGVQLVALEELNTPDGDID